MQSLRTPRAVALAGITLLVVSAAVASFAESYRGLFDWASHHGLHGAWAAMFPVQVDTFIAVGELALFVALADQWSVRSRSGAWTVTLLGLAVSVAANVGHVVGADLAARLTAAVPPLAASAALAVGLGVLKRVVSAQSEAAQSEAAQSEAAQSEAAQSEAAAIEVAVVPLETVTAGQRPAMAAIPRPASPSPAGATPQAAAPADAQAAAVKRSAARGASGPKSARTAAKVEAMLTANPDVTGKDVAAMLKVSERTGRRYLDMARSSMAAAA